MCSLIVRTRAEPVAAANALFTTIESSVFAGPTRYLAMAHGEAIQGIVSLVRPSPRPNCYKLFLSALGSTHVG